jgi:AraC-like DNA-binding protein
MAITARVPVAPLDASVARLRAWEGAAPYPRLAVFPIPTLHLLINFGDAYPVYGLVCGPSARARAEAECGCGPRIRPSMAGGASYVMGVWDAALVMDWPHASHGVGVTFRPGGAYPFLQLPLGELRNQMAPVEALWGRAAAEELRERLAAVSTPVERLVLLERHLLGRLAGWGATRRASGLEPRLARVRYGAAAIARAHGTLAIRALSDELGVSHKYLIAQFNELVGATPKALSRLYRLRSALAHLDPSPDPARPAHPITWAHVAQEAGYYDEPHFNRDFRAFTGLTPTDYLQGLRRFHAEHPGPVHALAPRFLQMGSSEPGQR